MVRDRPDAILMVTDAGGPYNASQHQERRIDQATM
jgi:hypothetical protein